MSRTSRKFPLNIPMRFTPFGLRVAVWCNQAPELYKSLQWMREHGGDPRYIADIERALGLKPGEKV